MEGNRNGNYSRMEMVVDSYAVIGEKQWILLEVIADNNTDSSDNVEAP